MTALLILVNCIVFWGWQVPEEKAVARVASIYASTPLPAMELPRFITHLQQESQRAGSRIKPAMVRAAKGMLKDKQYADLYQLMWQERQFARQLKAGQAIAPTDPQYEAWHAARASFDPREPKPFTARWAMSYEPGAGLQPVQALTSTFLHGSTSHLLGNMVFLFLFGFTLELALGAGVYLLFYLLCGVSASLFADLFYAGKGSMGLGASGAIAGLMAMYAVMYRMRRIRFFYIFAFYFNYARWPALVMLPVWMAFEVAQHFIGGGNVAYMAHFGGLLAGAIIMGVYMQLRTTETIVDTMAREKQVAEAQGEALRTATQRAQQLTDALTFDRAARAWREAAKLAPHDTRILRAWLDSARHAPASDDFHRAARAIFKLPAHSDADRQLQHHGWRLYAERAQPLPRISEASMHALLRSFVRLGEWGDAQKLCQQLAQSPTHPDWPASLALLTNGLAKAGRMDEARAWLPALQQAAPQEPITRWLAQAAGR